MHAITMNAVIIIAIFSVGYLFFIIRKTARGQLDIYDLVMLSTVAIIPLIFAVFPRLSYWLSGIMGVAFPFVVMFGMLFAILFIFVHRLTVKVHLLELNQRLLVQELSLLRQSEDVVGKNKSKIS